MTVSMDQCTTPQSGSLVPAVWVAPLSIPADPFVPYVQMDWDSLVLELAEQDVVERCVRVGRLDLVDISSEMEELEELMPTLEVLGSRSPHVSATGGRMDGFFILGMADACPRESMTTVSSSSREDADLDGATVELHGLDKVDRVLLAWLEVSEDGWVGLEALDVDLGGAERRSGSYLSGLPRSAWHPNSLG